MRKVLFPLALLVLCQCSTKHQPEYFEPFFYREGEPTWSNALQLERDRLEANPQRSLLQNKRLYELYQVEMRELKQGSTRYNEISDAAKLVFPAVSGEMESLTKLHLESTGKLQLKTPPPEKTDLRTPAGKKAYQEVYNLWNSDQNEAALEKWGKYESDLNFKSALSDVDWTRFLILRLRILLDLRKYDEATVSFKELRRLDGCSTEITQLGFVLSLHFLGNAKFQQGNEIYRGLCHKNEDSSTRFKFRYWDVRFQNAIEGKKEFGEFVSTELPGYYVYLAASQIGQPLVLPPSVAAMAPFLVQEFSVPGWFHKHLQAAEERLKVNLRRDAAIHIRKILSEQGEEVQPEARIPLLYAAELAQASGDHMTAFRLYNLVTRDMTGHDVLTQSFSSSDYMQRVFPRPFPDLVDSMTETWQMDPDLVYAIMRQESAFNPGAVSRSGARGLMQLMPALGRSIADRWKHGGVYSDRALFRAEENLRLGAFHLRYLYSRAPHLALVIASYNAGMKRMSGWWQRFSHMPLDIFVELIPVGETRDYVKLVLRNYISYKMLRSKGRVETNLFPMKLPAPPPMPVVMEN